MSTRQTAFDNVNGPSENGTSLSRLHEALMKYTPPPPTGLGAVITQDNWHVVYVSPNSLARNQQTPSPN